jgi:excinuclease UvrABC nuclease subunit
MSREEFVHLLADLRNQMDMAAQNLEFEKAANLRDQITQMEDLKEGKKITKRKR